MFLLSDFRFSRNQVTKQCMDMKKLRKESQKLSQWVLKNMKVWKSLLKTLTAATNGRKKPSLTVFFRHLYIRVLMLRFILTLESRPEKFSKMPSLEPGTFGTVMPHHLSTKRVKTLKRYRDYATEVPDEFSRFLQLGSHFCLQTRWLGSDHYRFYWYGSRISGYIFEIWKIL